MKVNKENKRCNKCATSCAKNHEKLIRKKLDSLTWEFLTNGSKLDPYSSLRE